MKTTTTGLFDGAGIIRSDEISDIVRTISVIVANAQRYGKKRHELFIADVSPAEVREAMLQCGATRVHETREYVRRRYGYGTEHFGRPAFWIFQNAEFESVRAGKPHKFALRITSCRT